MLIRISFIAFYFFVSFIFGKITLANFSQLGLSPQGEGFIAGKSSGRCGCFLDSIEHCPMHQKRPAIPAESNRRPLHNRQYSTIEYGYVVSNEWNVTEAFPVLASLKRGGAYIGVGTDINLSFIGMLEPDYVFFVDTDPLARRSIKIFMALLSLADTPEKFIELLKRERQDDVSTFLRGEFRLDELDSPETLAEHLATYRATLEDRFNKEVKSIQNSFLHSFKIYEIVRGIALRKNYSVITANIASDSVLVDLARTLIEKTIPVRAIYISNAWEYTAAPPPMRSQLVEETEGYRRGLVAMPIDHNSIVIATGGYAHGLSDRFLNRLPLSSILLNSYGKGDWRLAIVKLEDYRRKWSVVRP